MIITPTLATIIAAMLAIIIAPTLVKKKVLEMLKTSREVFLPMLRNTTTLLTS
jgi:uncharacterized membrane protein YgaE (UPF0421/DUF939 family)